MFVSQSPCKDKETLYDLYVEEGLSAADVGERLGCSDVTVLDWLDRHNISTRNPDPPTYTGEDHPRSLSEDEIIDDYKQVADELNKTPSQEEYNEHGEYTWSAIRGHFDGMGDLQKAAGLERHRKGRVTLECEICGDEYSEKHAKRNSSRFCSRECTAEWKSKAYRAEGNPNDYNQIQFTCEWCGDSYTEPVHKQDSTRFCSQECMVEWRSREYSGENHPRWKNNGRYYRGPNWNRQRKKAGKRDDFECQNCGGEDQLQVHHIIPYDSFDSYKEANKLQNLITLCVSCHHLLEWGSISVQSNLEIFVE